MELCPAVRAGAQTIAVVVPRRPARMPRDSLAGFVVTVDSVERLTGLRLLPTMMKRARRSRPEARPGL
ncbi:MAG TPA: hypothetical protein ENN51_04265, partial [candidate division WOR-3 bacterium]|nr:hypothetical protein [candidate division WOR-3 bacterium]